MNDYNENLSQVEILEQENQRLKEEIQFLKEELRRANARVTGLNSLNKIDHTENHLVEYFSNRYMEIHNFVLNSRLSVIDEDILKAQEIYDELTSREDMLEIIANRNALIQEQIVQIEEKISNNEERLNNLKKTREHMNNGNITPEDIKLILEVLGQEEIDLARTIYEIKVGLEDDMEYRETHRGVKK